MEPLWKLLYLLEPAPITLIVTAVAVTFGSAFRALNYGKEMERNHDLSEASITLDRSQALMIPIMSSCSLLLMFYLFSSVSQLLTAFTAIASVSSLYFCLFPYAAYVKSQFGLADPFVSRCCSKSFTRIQALLLLACSGIVAAWLVSGHWILNNLLGISICIAFVSHVRLPNIKICAMLLACLFVYDIFWVFFSERFFGANVMVSVATQQASNPVHTVANSLSLPGLQLITKKLELPVKIVFPRNLLGGVVAGGNAADFMMLGLGDMVARISTMVGSQTTAAAAEAAVTALCDENSFPREIFDVEEDHISNGLSSPTASYEAERVLKNEESKTKEGLTQSETANTPHKRDDIPLTLQIRASIATALGAAAARAKLLAEQEDREVENLVAIIIETQMKKLHQKIKHFEDLELIMEKEYAEMEELKDCLLAERIGVLQKAINAGISRWRDHSVKS